MIENYFPRHEEVPTEAVLLPHSKIYYITKKGDLYNYRGNKLSPYKSNGYCNIKLREPIVGKRKTYLIHRLVYETFLGPIPKGYWINHKDGNKSNNNVDNLEAMHPSDIQLHPTTALRRRYLRGSDAPQGKLTDKAVQIIRELYTANTYSQYDLAEAFQVSQASISNIVNNKSFKELSLL